MKAAMDIGSNSLRLLVIEEAGGTSQVIRQEVEETRLGAGFKEGMLLSASEIALWRCWSAGKKNWLRRASLSL